MAITVSELLQMSQAQLDELFTKSPAGNIPVPKRGGKTVCLVRAPVSEDKTSASSPLGCQNHVSFY